MLGEIQMEMQDMHYLRQTKKHRLENCVKSHDACWVQKNQFVVPANSIPEVKCQPIQL